MDCINIRQGHVSFNMEEFIHLLIESTFIGIPHLWHFVLLYFTDVASQKLHFPYCGGLEPNPQCLQDTPALST